MSGKPKNSNDGTPIVGAATGDETAIVFGFNIATLVLTMGTQSLLAWHLAPSGRGIYAICILFSLLLGTFFTLGIDRSSQIFTISRNVSLSNSVSTALLVTVSGSVFSIIVFLIFTNIYPNIVGYVEIDLLNLSTPLIPLTIIFVTFQLQAAGMRRFIRLGQINLIQIAVNLTLLAILTWGIEGGVAGAVISYEISLAIGIILFWLDLRRNCQLTLNIPNWRLMLPVIQYGMRYYAARIGQQIDLQVGLIVLGFIASPGEVGVYAAASALAFKLAIIPQSVETAILPRISVDAVDRINLIGKAIRISFLLTGAAAIALMATSIRLIPILFSPAFSEAILIIFVLAPAAIFHSTSLIFMAHFRSINRPGTISLVVIITICVSSVSLLILYPMFGLMGAGLAITSGAVVRALALIFIYSPKPGSSRLDLFRFNLSDLLAIQNLVARIGVRIGLFAGDRQ